MAYLLRQSIQQVWTAIVQFDLKMVAVHERSYSSDFGQVLFRFLVLKSCLLSLSLVINAEMYALACHNVAKNLAFTD